MSRILTPMIIGFALTLLVGCSPSSSTGTASTGSPAAASSSAAQTVTVQGTDTFKFQPATLTVKAGQPVQLTFSNTGQTLHDWSLADGAGQPVKIIAAGGASASGTFTIAKPGTYTFICSQPGHEAAGMKGTITAQ
ncbi:MAG: cupredoxin domain-containing protein [Chloroflexota bacterium]